VARQTVSYRVGEKMTVIGPGVSYWVRLKNDNFRVKLKDVTNWVTS